MSEELNVKPIVDLNNFADGAFAYRVNQEMQKVIENINDLNTDEKKAREINIKLKLIPGEKRKDMDVDILVSSKLQPAITPSTKILIGYNEEKQLTGKELRSSVVNQMFFDPHDEEVKTDIGQPVEEAELEESKGVVQFKAK